MSDHCPWTIKWGILPDSITCCDQPAGHETTSEHEGPGLPQFPHQRIHWQPGDRREFIGEYPGRCESCVLPAGHHGRHA